MERRDRYLIAAFRRIFRWEPSRRLVIKGCFSDGKYRCQKCNKLHKKIVVDHIEPVIDPLRGWEGWDVYYERLFVPKEQLQGLCKKCHAVKTKQENSQRRESNKKDCKEGVKKDGHS